MKVALVQDWFVVNGGAEKVVREIVAMYPDIEIFSLVDFLSDEDRDYILAGKKVNTSYLQKIPFAKKHYRNFLVLFPHAIESLDFSSFDLIISSSSSVAKGIKKNRQADTCLLLSFSRSLCMGSGRRLPFKYEVAEKINS